MFEVLSARITLARESRGFTQKALAEKTGVTQGFISKVENGRQQLNDPLIQNIADVLGYPPSFFYQPLVQQGMPASLYRRRASVSPRTLKKIEARVNIALDHLKTLTSAAEIPEQFLPAMDIRDYGDSPERVSQELRFLWGARRGPIPDLTSMAEQHGVVVIPFDFESRNIDALSIRPDRSLPVVVFISDGLPGDRWRLTLAHELGHLIMHHQPVAIDRDIEQEAFAFAAEFLMPAAEIRLLLRRPTLQKLVALKGHWRVSMAALIMRATALECINQTQAQYLWRQMNKFGFRTEEPAPIARENPRCLQDMVRAHLDELNYSDADLSASLHMRVEEFRAEYRPRPMHLRVV